MVSDCSEWWFHHPVILISVVCEGPVGYSYGHLSLKQLGIYMMYHPSVSFNDLCDSSRMNDTVSGSPTWWAAWRPVRGGWVLAGQWEGTGRTNTNTGGILIGDKGLSFFQ